MLCPQVMIKNYIWKKEATSIHLLGHRLFHTFDFQVQHLDQEEWKLLSSLIIIFQNSTFYVL